MNVAVGETSDYILQSNPIILEGEQFWVAKKKEIRRCQKVTDPYVALIWNTLRSIFTKQVC